MKFMILICVIVLCFHQPTLCKRNEEKQKKQEKEERGQKRARCPVLNEKEYDLTLSLLKRSYPIPVDDRTKLQTKVYQKISLFKLQQTFIHDPYPGRESSRIMIDGKILLPRNQVKDCIHAFYRNSKGDGAKKLCYAIRQSFYGIGEKIIQKHLNQMECHRILNPRFDNNAPLKPVVASNIMDRHQIDIVDLTSIAVTIDDREFRYVLSVLDVFSRFLWLRALSDKSANTVANELYNIYVEFGPPKIIQNDQGSELKGHVKELCVLLGTKLIYSRSNHPQSQGKDERSHQTWKKKIHQDLIKTQNEGICNWVTSLPALQRIYNEGLHTSLGISPYECLFGIHSNHLTNRITDQEIEEIEEEENTCDIDENQQEKIIEQHLNILQELHSKAKKKADKASGQVVRSKLSKNPPSKYVRGDRVLIKCKRKDSRVSRGGSSMTAPKVFEGAILESNFENYRYKVKFTDSNGKVVTKRTSVGDLTSTVHSDEEKRIRLAKLSAAQKGKIKISADKQHKTGLFVRNALEKLQNMILESIKISKTQDTRNHQLMLNAQNSGLELHADNSGDGNCMFMALSHQLLTHGIEINHGNLRQQLVDYMRNNPVLRSSDGTINLCDFIYGYGGNLNDYLNQMAIDRTWGDNLVLIAAANVFNARIIVVSSLPNADNIIIEPTNRQVGIELYLGHLHELNYVILMQIVNHDCHQYLCDTCGNTSDRKDNHECSPMKDQQKIMSTFPLIDEEIIYFKNHIINMLSDLEQNKQNCSGQIIPLAKDHLSQVFFTFLNSAGVSFDEEIIDGEYFIKVPSVYMDMYDDFRSKLSGICGTLSLIILTGKVKRWLQEIEGFDDEIQQLWFPLMFLITRRAKESLTAWLDENGQHGVETVDEIENED